MSTPTTSLKVMLIEDDTTFREALAFVLDKEQELEVVAQAGSLAGAREALDGASRGAWTWRCWTCSCPTGTAPSS